MKFGIFYEHQLPRPWGAEDEHQLLKDALAQVELADQLGYDYVREVEHHFLEEYSHSSAHPRFSSLLRHSALGHEREADRQREKSTRLADAIERALKRRESAREVDTSYTVPSPATQVF